MFPTGIPTNFPSQPEKKSENRKLKDRLGSEKRELAAAAAQARAADRMSEGAMAVDIPENKENEDPGTEQGTPPEIKKMMNSFSNMLDKKFSHQRVEFDAARKETSDGLKIIKNEINSVCNRVKSVEKKVDKVDHDQTKLKSDFVRTNAAVLANTNALNGLAAEQQTTRNELDEYKGKFVQLSEKMSNIWDIGEQIKSGRLGNFTKEREPTPKDQFDAKRAFQKSKHGVGIKPIYPAQLQSYIDRRMCNNQVDAFRLAFSEFLQCYMGFKEDFIKNLEEHVVEIIYNERDTVFYVFDNIMSSGGQRIRQESHLLRDRQTGSIHDPSIQRLEVPQYRERQDAMQKHSNFLRWDWNNKNPESVSQGRKCQTRVECAFNNEYDFIIQVKIPGQKYVTVPWPEDKELPPIEWKVKEYTSHLEYAVYPKSLDKIKVSNFVPRERASLTEEIKRQYSAPPKEFHPVKCHILRESHNYVAGMVDPGDGNHVTLNEAGNLTQDYINASGPRSTTLQSGVPTDYQPLATGFGIGGSQFGTRQINPPSPATRRKLIAEAAKRGERWPKETGPSRDDDQNLTDNADWEELRHREEKKKREAELQRQRDEHARVEEQEEAARPGVLSALFSWLVPARPAGVQNVSSGSSPMDTESDSSSRQIVNVSTGSSSQSVVDVSSGSSSHIIDVSSGAASPETTIDLVTPPDSSENDLASEMENIAQTTEREVAERWAEDEKRKIEEEYEKSRKEMEALQNAETQGDWNDRDLFNELSNSQEQGLADHAHAVTLADHVQSNISQMSEFTMSQSQLDMSQPGLRRPADPVISRQSQPTTMTQSSQISESSFLQRASSTFTPGRYEEDSDGEFVTPLAGTPARKSDVYQFGVGNSPALNFSQKYKLCPITPGSTMQKVNIKPAGAEKSGTMILPKNTSRLKKMLSSTKKSEEQEERVSKRRTATAGRLSAKKKGGAKGGSKLRQQLLSQMTSASHKKRRNSGEKKEDSKKKKANSPKGEKSKKDVEVNKGEAASSIEEPDTEATDQSQLSEESERYEETSSGTEYGSCIADSEGEEWSEIERNNVSQLSVNLLEDNLETSDSDHDETITATQDSTVVLVPASQDTGDAEAREATIGATGEEEAAGDNDTEDTESVVVEQEVTLDSTPEGAETPNEEDKSGEDKEVNEHIEVVKEFEEVRQSPDKKPAPPTDNSGHVAGVLAEAGGQRINSDPEGKISDLTIDTNGDVLNTAKKVQLNKEVD